MLLIRFWVNDLAVAECGACVGDRAFSVFARVTFEAFAIIAFEVFAFGVGSIATALCAAMKEFGVGEHFFAVSVIGVGIRFVDRGFAANGQNIVGDLANAFFACEALSARGAIFAGIIDIARGSVGAISARAAMGAVCVGIDDFSVAVGFCRIGERASAVVADVIGGERAIFAAIVRIVGVFGVACSFCAAMVHIGERIDVFVAASGVSLAEPFDASLVVVADRAAGAAVLGVFEDIDRSAAARCFEANFGEIGVADALESGGAISEIERRDFGAEIGSRPIGARRREFGAFGAAVVFLGACERDIGLGVDDADVLGRRARGDARVVDLLERAAAGASQDRKRKNKSKRFI